RAQNRLLLATLVLQPLFPAVLLVGLGAVALGWDGSRDYLMPLAAASSAFAAGVGLAAGLKPGPNPRLAVPSTSMVRTGMRFLSIGIGSLVATQCIAIFGPAVTTPASYAVFAVT